MKNEKNKLYVMKLKYTLIDVTQDKKQFSFKRKKKKLYLVKDPNSVEGKLRELEDLLLEAHEAEETNVFLKAQDFLKNFGRKCNTTYQTMLNT